MIKAEKQDIREVPVKIEFIFEGTTQEFTGLMIRLKREILGMNIISLAEALKMNRKRLGQIESGTVPQTASELETICKALKCHSSELLPF